jgi:alkylhydroperoxidase family enzyme
MTQPSLNFCEALAANEQPDPELSRLIELVRLRGAQLLDCTEVIDLHARQLLNLGEDMGRIGEIFWWPESSVFTPKERMAFALCEALVIIDHVELADVLIAMVRQELSEEEILRIAIAVNAVIDWSETELRDDFRRMRATA